jgi:hypothetical protein
MKTFLLAIGLLGYSISFAQLPVYISQDSLVSFYGLDGNAQDLSGNGHNGSFLGATPTTDRFGNPNSAFQLSSVGSKITLMNWGPWLLKDRTISFWFSGQNNGNLQRILGYRTDCSGAPSEQGFEFIINPTLPKIETWNANYPNVVGSTFQPTNWTHVIFVKRDTTASFYVQGTLTNTFHPLGPITQNATFGVSSAISCIANFPGSSAIRFQGKIDEIGVWNRAFSDQEVTNLFNNVITGKKSNIETMVSVYPNPATDEIAIVVRPGNENQPFFLLDQLGRKVFNGHLKGLYGKVDVKNLDAGIYFLAIEGQPIRKIILN